MTQHHHALIDIDTLMVGQVHSVESCEFSAILILPVNLNQNEVATEKFPQSRSSLLTPSLLAFWTINRVQSQFEFIPCNCNAHTVTVDYRQYICARHILQPLSDLDGGFSRFFVGIFEVARWPFTSRRFWTQQRLKQHSQKQVDEPSNRITSQANTDNPCLSTIASNLSAIPLGCFAPDSHFSTVDSLVLR
jgi:hypothetical protein